MSTLMSPSMRPEDAVGFYTRAVDSLTLRRFVAACPPKPAVGPHQHRANELARTQAQRTQAEVQLVASLTLPDAEE